MRGLQDDLSAHRAVEAERAGRTRRKLFMMARRAAWMVGIGLGLLLVHLVIPAEDQKADTTAFFTRLGTTLVSCGGLQLVGIVILRGNALKLGLVINGLVLPAIVVKLVMDVMH